jgi:hypothetical protein
MAKIKSASEWSETVKKAKNASELQVAIDALPIVMFKRLRNTIKKKSQKLKEKVE